MNDGPISVIDLKRPPNELVVAVERFKRGTDTMIEYQLCVAKIQRAKYQACIDEGFSAEEALELCKTITVE